MADSTGQVRAIEIMREKMERNERFVTFEFFPPKTEEGVKNLLNRMERFKKQDPVFMDMTWGAGGSTSDLTLDLCVNMVKLGIESNMHLTCTNMPEEKIDIALEGAKEANIRNIVALRGDPPAGQEWQSVEGGFSCALDLVKHIRQNYDDYFSVSVSGYPEGHPNAISKIDKDRQLSDAEKGRLVEMKEGLYVCTDEDFAKEVDYVKQKVEAGADFLITQMVFDAEVYKSFVDACRAAGITVPILPGIMCIQNYNGFQRMTNFCKSRVPQELRDKIEAAKDDNDKVKEVAIDFGAELCQKLLDYGAPGLHFYTLNLEKVTLGILEKLGMRKDSPSA